MAVITLDSTLTGARATWRRIDAGESYRGSGGAVTQYAGSALDRWGLSLTWQNLHGSKLATLEAFLDRLGHMRNTLRLNLKEHLAYTRQGTPGTCEFDGAHNAGVTQISFTSTGTLVAGDFVTIGKTLHRIVHVSGADADIQPPLHQNAADNDPIEDDDVYSHFYLVRPFDTPIRPLNGSDWVATVTVELEEDVYAQLAALISMR